MNLFVVRSHLDAVLRPAVRALARLPVSANAWTALAWAAGIGAAVLFIQGWWAVGIIVFALRGLLDHVDGYVARERGDTSVLGAVLDDLADRYVIAVFVLFATAHLAGPFPHLPYVAAFAVAGTMVNAFCKPCVYVETQDAVRRNGKITHPMDLVGMFGSAEFLIYFGIPTLGGALARNAWPIVVGIWLTAILSHVSLLQRLVYVARNYGRGRRGGDPRPAEACEPEPPAGGSADAAENDQGLPATHPG